MSLFLSNLLLALIWAAAGGQFTLTNLTMGFAVGYLVLLLIRPVLPPSDYHARFWRTLAFIGFYAREVVKASLRVVYEVITPGHSMNPGVIGLPLDARTDVEIATLANLISFTPGTLSLDVSKDRRTLYIHAMYIDEDVETLRRELKDTLERRVLSLFRGPEWTPPDGRTSPEDDRP